MRPERNLVWTRTAFLPGITLGDRGPYLNLLTHPGALGFPNTPRRSLRAAMRLLAYGALNPDLVHQVDRLPTPGDDLRSRGWQLTWGGKVANAAVALTAWGVDVAIAGLVLGEDPLGDALVAALEPRGLDLSLVERDPAEVTRHCVVLVTPDGDRSIVCTGYDGARWQDLPAGAWEGIDGVLVDGLSGEAGRTVAAEARRRGLPLVWLDAPADVEGADLVVWSRHEHRPEDAEALAARGTPVVLTAGPDPVGVWWGDRVAEVVPPKVEARDGTGAGDVFAAACLRGLVERWDAEEVVRWAVAAATASVRRGRGEGPPGEEEIGLPLPEWRPRLR